MTVAELNKKQMVKTGFSQDFKNYRGFPVEDLQKAFTKIQNKENWKNPVMCKCHHSQVELVLTAIEFYHADTAQVVGTEPITGYVLIRGNGYQAY